MKKLHEFKLKYAQGCTEDNIDYYLTELLALNCQRVISVTTDAVYDPYENGAMTFALSAIAIFSDGVSTPIKVDFTMHPRLVVGERRRAHMLCHYEPDMLISGSAYYSFDPEYIDGSSDFDDSMPYYEVEQGSLSSGYIAEDAACFFNVYTSVLSPEHIENRPQFLSVIKKLMD